MGPLVFAHELSERLLDAFENERVAGQEIHTERLH